MRRFIFYSLLIGTLVFAAVLAGAFLIHALEVMDKASRAHPNAIARFGTPLGDIDIAIGVIIASLGVLLLCYRYANRLPLTGKELFRRMDQEEKNELRREAALEASRVAAHEEREALKKMRRSL